MQNLQEKDIEYNALVKKLKDRIFAIEKELQDTQKKAGMPVFLPVDNTSPKLTPQLSRKHPPNQLFKNKAESDYSDQEISDLSPDLEGEDGKTSTVERKIQSTDEFDAIPKHELLDSKASKSKKDLASRGTLAHRQLPSSKKFGSSNSGSNGTLDSDDEINIDGSNPTRTNGTPLLVSTVNTEPAMAPSVPLYALIQKVHREKERTERNEPITAQTFSSKTHSTIPNMFRENCGSSCGSDLNVSYNSSDMCSSTDKIDNSSLMEVDCWNNRRTKGVKGYPSLTEQLKERLAEREGKKPNNDSSRDSSNVDFCDLNLISQNLLCEIKKAVNDAQTKGN